MANSSSATRSKDRNAPRRIIDKDEVSLRFVAEGLRVDVDELVKAFAESWSYDFSDFAKLWVQRKFSLVFMGRENEDELREFIGESFMMALSYVISSSNMRIQIAGFYLLYCLYIKQPSEPRYKIRVTLYDWQQIQSLLKFADANKCYSVKYIFQQLILQRAFSCTHGSRLIGPLMNCQSETTEVALKDLNKMREPLKEFLDTGYLQKLNSLHEMYECEKSSLPNAVENDLNMLREDLSGTITSHFEKLLTNRSFDSDFVKRLLKQTIQGPSGARESADEHIGMRRMLLKNKQFSSIKESRFASKYNELLHANQDDIESEDIVSDEARDVTFVETPTVIRRKRFKKKKLRGRPKRYIRDEDMAEEEGLGEERLEEEGVDDVDWGMGEEEDVDEDDVETDDDGPESPPTHYPSGRKIAERCKRNYTEYAED